MKVILNKILPFGKKYYAINLFGILFAKGPCDKYIVNHEEIHTRQIRELLYIFFYLWYCVEWLVRSVQYSGFHKGYRNISFEREAYANGNNLGYLTLRSRYAFLKYVRARRY